MDRKEHLKAMLTNLIHDRNDEAKENFHSFLQSKMRDLVNPQEVQEEESGTDE